MKQISNKLKFKTIVAAFAAAVLASGAQGAERITVDEVANHYPWDGKVDCVTTLSGLDTTGVYKYEGAFTLSVKKDGANICKTVTNDFANANGTYTNTFDCVALFGAGRYPNGGIVVDLVKKELGGVQLWENGPYWAECNVGATKPEEYGYYFWWGDTVGYTCEVGPTTEDSYYSDVTWVSSTGTRMSSSPFNSITCRTYDKSTSLLQSLGYIDSTGNLVAANDAATAHLDRPWRMPTSDEIQALVDNCEVTWITTNGVSGRLVTGKGEYATRSIFLPAAGCGHESYLNDPGTKGYYWSSTPHSDHPYRAFGLNFYSEDFLRSYDNRDYGQAVRPLRTK